MKTTAGALIIVIVFSALLVAFIVLIVKSFTAKKKPGELLPPIAADISPSGKIKKIGFWKWVLIIFFALWVYATIKQSTPEGKKENELITAYSMAQVFVERQLKSPKSADFPSMKDPMVRILKETRPNEYFVTGYVDSKNSFGVDVRTRYTITMRYHPENNNWETINLTFGN